MLRKISGLVVLAVSVAHAQTVRFDVASVKPNTDGPSSMLWSYRGRRFTARYATAKALISTAYGSHERSLANAQISGAPAWLDTDRFDVVATSAEVPDSPRGTFPAPVLAMLRNLMEERFQLRTHGETKELPVFALTVARRDGVLGPRLRRRALDCVAGQGQAREPRNLFNPTPAERRICGGRVGPGVLTASGMTTTNFVSALTNLMPGVERIVIDRTGLTGTFDVDLTWRFEPPLNSDVAPTPDPNAPTLFTALQEQLGLKLEPTRAPVDILYIDRVEHPSED